MMRQEIEGVNVKALIESTASLTRQLEAKDKRIRHLEFVLAQRAEETRRSFDPKKVGEMCRKCFKIFLDNPGVGFSYANFNAAFACEYGFRSAHLPQRLRDLRRDGLIWSSDESGEVTFYLKLKGDGKA